MISYVRGNLFESPAQAWVNTVNTEGVMGKGIALTYKRLFPEMFEEYRQLCEQRRLRIGALHFFRYGSRLIVNFPTKTTWRKPSSPGYIAAGLRTFVSVYEQYGVQSVAFPPLGCGNGELDFEGTVRPLMEEYLSNLPIPVYIYPPQGVEPLAEHRTRDEMEAWLARESNVLGFDSVWNDIEDLSRNASFVAVHTGEQFTASVERDAEDDLYLRIVPAGGVPFYVSRSELESAWTSFRSRLVITPDSFGSGSRAGAYVLSMLQGLSYMKRFFSSGEPGKEGGIADFALRWTPGGNSALSLKL